MPLFLRHRNPDLIEYMDREDCDLHRLKNTYNLFSHINRILSGWKKVYRKEIRPVIESMDGRTSILDIGFGGGDIPLKIAKWAEQDGLDVEITAIETDKRAVDHVQHLQKPENVEFLHCSTSDLLKKGKRYDLILSNHLLHHLNQEEMDILMEECRQLATHTCIFNDIERSDLGYLLFSIFALPAAFHSFIWADGLISIRRSYTLNEIRKQLPEGWFADRLFPFRLLIKQEATHA